jgi:hypothetical protein
MLLPLYIVLLLTGAFAFLRSASGRAMPSTTIGDSMFANGRCSTTPELNQQARVNNLVSIALFTKNCSVSQDAVSSHFQEAGQCTCEFASITEALFASLNARDD